MVDDACPSKGESQNEIKMERGIEEKDLGVNPDHLKDITKRAYGPSNTKTQR